MRALKIPLVFRAQFYISIVRQFLVYFKTNQQLRSENRIWKKENPMMLKLKRSL